MFKYLLVIIPETVDMCEVPRILSIRGDSDTRSGFISPSLSSSNEAEKMLVFDNHVIAGSAKSLGQ